jgi:hypothetical protein
MTTPLASSVDADPAEILRLAERVLKIILAYGSATIAEVADELGLPISPVQFAFQVCEDDRLIDRDAALTPRSRPRPDPYAGSWQDRYLWRVTAKGIRQLAREAKAGQ